MGVLVDSKRGVSYVIRKSTTPTTVNKSRPLSRSSIYRLQMLVFPGTEERPTCSLGPLAGASLSRWPLIRYLLASLGPPKYYSTVYVGVSVI